MKRGLLSIGAAVALTAAALPISADAQHARGAAGAPAVSAGGAPGGGVGAGARGGMSSSPAISAPRSGGNFAASPGARTAPSQSFAQGGGNWQGSGRNWQGGNWQHHRRHHFRGPAVAFGFAAPYYYDYATPYVYEDDDCWQVRLRRGEYVRVWVCD
jgi:hypothetical protein